MDSSDKQLGKMITDSVIQESPSEVMLPESRAVLEPDYRSLNGELEGYEFCFRADQKYANRFLEARDSGILAQGYMMPFVNTWMEEAAIGWQISKTNARENDDEFPYLDSRQRVESILLHELDKHLSRKDY